MNEIECTLQEVGEYPERVCTWVEVPDLKPSPWRNCDEEPCTDCEEPEPELDSLIKEFCDNLQFKS